MPAVYSKICTADKTRTFQAYTQGEAGINVWTKRTRGWARRGDRAVRMVQERRGQNLTMTFAVNVMNGLVHHDLHLGEMTVERFNQFLHNTSLQCNPGQEICFIFDNARAHGRAAEANLPAEFEMQYLPPYYIHLF
ncbi:insertion element IS630 uncharacterized 39 kDa protein [Elysia marginata]|uniref:Insertion element IS630 uncharacterized 39 kDa protein n=1 Tax=Elysia marginata TaxID=1093978 RepID=A0AAV4H300_9GAST|nr:insertion element IS630 uncharacterized 39 kDa protein [Elysia marginata]